MLFDRYPERRKVIANLKSGEAFRGVLWARGRRFLVLRNAEMLRPREQVVRMDGEVVVEWKNVSFLQVV